MISKNINHKNNPLTIKDNEYMINSDNDTLLKVIHNLSSIDFYLKLNSNPSLVIDNLIFSL